MKNLFLLLLVLLSFNVESQSHLIGAKVGINITNIISDDIKEDYKFKLGFNSGLTYEFLFKKYFSVGTELIYNQLGFSENFLYTDFQGTPIGSYSFCYNFDYISFPVKTGFNFGNKFFFLGNIGLVPSLLINSKIITPRFNLDGDEIGKDKIDVTNQVSKFDLSGIAEIGGGYKFQKKIILFTSIGYQFSILKISNSDYFENNKIRHFGIIPTLGIKYDLAR